MKWLFWVAILVLICVDCGFAQEKGRVDQDGVAWKQIRVTQGDLSIVGSYRLRGESQHEYNIKEYGTDEDEDYLLFRLRLDFELDLSGELKAFIQFQDSRIFGSSFDDKDFELSNPYHDNMDVRQAFVDYEPLKGVELSLRGKRLRFVTVEYLGLGTGEIPVIMSGMQPR